MNHSESSLLNISNESLRFCLTLSYHHNNEIPNNRMDQGNNLNYLYYIQSMNRVEQFVLHLKNQSFHFNQLHHCFPYIQHLSAINIHLHWVKNVILHYIDVSIVEHPRHTNDRSNMNLDQQRNPWHPIDMYNYLYSRENYSLSIRASSWLYLNSPLCLIEVNLNTTYLDLDPISSVHRYMT